MFVSFTPIPFVNMVSMDSSILAWNIKGAASLQGKHNVCELV